MDWFLARSALQMDSLTILVDMHPTVLVVPTAALAWGIWYWRSGRTAPRAAHVVRYFGGAVLVLGIFLYFDGLRQAKADCSQGHDGLCWLIGAFVSEGGAILTLAGVLTLVAARVLRGRRRHIAATP